MLKVDYQKWWQSFTLSVAAVILFIFLTSDTWAVDGSKPLGQINQYLRMTGELRGMGLLSAKPRNEQRQFL